ncbi:hypothetical protein L3Q72_00680 [Vibrio sp. JC009]|uniref:hypothetical protein n=1 Tax=Vibrio sp. JC009 TaxID=2912314 RepID=UPI0023B0B22C|nr:hypothetical protein [Vibrio sp. JC009]WED21966.1 hypothetical protein L3Q72_00680 [Vibrio sp. JC009]
MKLSRRGWNNLLILCIIIFIVALNLPNILKSAFDEQELSPYPYLLSQEKNLLQVDFAKWSLKRDGTNWVATKDLSISALELVQRWKSLVGTEVTESTFTQLKPTLPNAQTIEVWYVEVEEPQRITYYQTPQFWLMKNWQEKWIAVSVDEGYLFPF